MLGWNTLGAVLSLIKKNWLKIALVGFALFLLLKKDISLNIRLDAPQKPVEEQEPAEQGEKLDIHDVLSEKVGGNGPTMKDQTFELIPAKKTNPENTPVIKPDNMLLTEAAVEAYLQRFAKVAKAEKKKFGIPASVILGAAIVRSKAGQEILSTHHHNHFGLPCGNGWDGQSVEINNKCYREYENAWNSFRDHSIFISNQLDVASLKNAPYNQWLKPLEKIMKLKGFSRQLEVVIQKNDLTRFDRP